MAPYMGSITDGGTGGRGHPVPWHHCECDEGIRTECKGIAGIRYKCKKCGMDMSFVPDPPKTTPVAEIPMKICSCGAVVTKEGCPRQWY